MNPKKLSDCIENSDNCLVQQAQQIPNYAQQHRKKAAEKLDRGCRVYCAHGVQLLRGRVCLCQRDCGRGSYRAGDTNN